MPALTVIGISALAAFALLFPVRGLLRRLGVVDKPNARSSHSVPTVRGAGVGIVATIAAAMALFGIRYSGGSGDSIFVDGHSGRAGESLLVEGYSSMQMSVLLGALLLLAVISFLDDLRGLKAGLRLAVQLACAVVAVSVLLANNVQPITITAILLGLVAVVWVAGYTNAFNFMDGINGIAATQAIVTGAGTALIATRLGLGVSTAPVLIALAIAGAALGFLPHNFPRARVFMGDVSSATLGFLLAVLAFWIARLTSWWALFWIGLLHANFVLDTGVTLVRRARRGDRLSEAHREHFYQRLVRAGASHTKVTLIETGLQVLVALALWWATPGALRANAEGGMQNGEWIWMLVVALGVLGVWAAFFAYAEAKFRKAGSLSVGR